MAVGTDDPAVQRRRLRVELRSLRKKRGHTQRDVAHAMDWSPSKLIRIENGDVRITPTDLRVLLNHYGVTEPRDIDPLVAMARSSRQDSWSEFRDVHTAPWLTFLGYESSASVIRDYETLLVPGLLQTEEYALAWYKSIGIDEDVAEKRWEGRLRRQELHERDDPPKMYFLLDEAVVLRQVGGVRVMRRQLQRFRELGEAGHVTIQVIPFSAGGYGALGQSFVLLEFPDANDDDLLHIEDPGGGVTMRDDVDATADALERFVGLEDIALSADETRQLFDRLIDGGSATAGGGGETKESP